MAIATAGVQWGDVGTWVGGIATATALILTLILLRITRQEQTALRTEQRQAQARKVSAWCDQVQPVAGDRPYSVTVTLRNSSDEPIYGVHVAVGVEWSREKVHYGELKGLGYIIPPDYKERHTLSLRLSSTAAGSYARFPPIEIIFNDAAGGRFWRRDRYGGLAQLKERQPNAAVAHFFTMPANLIQARPVWRGLLVPPQ